MLPLTPVCAREKSTLCVLIDVTQRLYVHANTQACTRDEGDKVRH